jgi:hypothetical protein
MRLANDKEHGRMIRRWEKQSPSPVIAYYRRSKFAAANTRSRAVVNLVSKHHDGKPASAFLRSLNDVVVNAAIPLSVPKDTNAAVLNLSIGELRFVVCKCKWSMRGQRRGQRRNRSSLIMRTKFDASATTVAV